VDLAQTNDLVCAEALTVKDGVKYILQMYFIPERKLLPENDDHNAGAKYKEWVDAGYITVAGVEDVDLSRVAEWFYSLYNDYGIKLYKCGYDQRFSKEWLTAMETYGWFKGDSIELVLQNAETLSNAIYLTEAELKAQKINYNNNPVMRWCLGNSCLKVNEKRQALIVKTNDAKKIDGSVTLASVNEMFRRYRTELKSKWGL
jgi:phage terminase large subunit-like protein